MQNFPQELLHCIVDFVGDDRQTLATIRLVSRAWNISARALLFSSLDLLISIPPPCGIRRSSGGLFHPPKPKYKGIEKFITLLSILDSSNDISYCVRQVSLGRTASFSVMDSESRKQQKIYASLISSILSRFSRLSCVVFRQMNWSNFAPSFLSCILEICKTPTLERIEMWNCQMPTTSSLLDFLSASRNVKGLRLSYFRILSTDIRVEETKLSPSNTVEDPALDRPCDMEPYTSLLHSLAIDAASDVFLLENMFGMRPHSIKLRQLYLGNVNDTARVAGFLQKAGHSLEFLDIRLIPYKQIPTRLSEIDLDLSHCPSLQHLRISGLHWTPSLCPSEYLSSLFARTSGRPLRIESLQLVVSVIQPKPTTPVGFQYIIDDPSGTESDILVLSGPAELQYSDWSILDTVLSSRTFPVLKSFEISTKTVREGKVDPSRLSVMFPKLKDNGVLVTCT